MSLVVEYERPRFIERRTTGKMLHPGRVILLSLCGMLPAILTQVTSLGRWLHLPYIALAGLFAGPGMIAIVYALCSTVSCTTLVYSDRLQVDLFVARYRFSRSRYPWQRIESFNALSGDLPGSKPRYVLKISPGYKVIMYFGRGINLSLRPSGRCVIGSDQIEQLLAAIELQRSCIGASV